MPDVTTPTVEQVKPQTDLTAERDARVLPVAEQIVIMLGSEPLPLGNVTEEQRKLYFPLAKRILTLCRDANLKFSDMNYLFQLVLQRVDIISFIVKQSIDTAWDSAATNLWGKPSDQVTLQDADKIIVPTTTA